MSRQVNLYEAKTRLSELVEEAAKGNEIVIAKNGKVMARLVTARPETGTPRKFGQWGRALTSDELAIFRSEEWWHRWKQADAEIERDFSEALEKDNPGWLATSSTRTPSSGSRRTPVKSGRKRSRK